MVKVYSLNIKGFYRKVLPLQVRLKIHDLRNKTKVKVIPIEQILMGGEGGIDVGPYSKAADDFQRPSRTISESPHYNFLLSYKNIGEKLLEEREFLNTEYYLNAKKCIELTGSYFGEKDLKGVIRVAQGFIQELYNPMAGAAIRAGQTSPGTPILLRPIKYSDYFTLIDGHHRVAISKYKGDQTVFALIIGEPELTLIQQLTLDVLWTQGRKELYQPIHAPELSREWILVRNCVDRFDMMQEFLNNYDIKPFEKLTYLDIGSCYGWFVKEMEKIGYISFGVERDPNAILVGKKVYGIKSDQITNSDIYSFLINNMKTFDVVSCFSVVHHFLLGKENVSAEEIIRMISKITNKVLFFDTGQNHEEWFKELLPNWDDDFIEKWLKKNTEFKTIIKLGKDRDNKNPFENNYGRTLFACLKAM